MRPALLVFLLAGCSAVADSSIDRLKCDAETPCDVDKGYSCRFDECVKKGSVKEGDTCQLTEQCGAGLVCPPLISVCLKPCVKIFDLDSGCPADKYCGPVYDLKAENRGKFVGGACIPVECPSGESGDDKCRKEGGKFAVKPNDATKADSMKCVRVAKNGGVCMRTCSVGRRCAAGSNCSGADACLADSRGNPQHCGVLGVGDLPTLVCLPAGSAPEGASCSIFPLSGDSKDACSLNVNGNVADLPLVCMNGQGGTSGNLKCHKATCTGTGTECAANFACTGSSPTTPPFQYCAELQ